VGISNSIINITSAYICTYMLRHLKTKQCGWCESTCPGNV